MLGGQSTREERCEVEEGWSCVNSYHFACSVEMHLTWGGHLLRFHCVCLCTYVTAFVPPYSNSGFHSSEVIFQVMTPCSLVDGILNTEHENSISHQNASIHLPYCMMLYFVRPQCFSSSFNPLFDSRQGQRVFCFHSIQTSSGTHPASYRVGTRSSSLRGEVALTSI